ncbi:Trehalose utilization [Planctopirus ephydatiae]|uniref:Trehalose utilization n=2 Tax=Planctopirus ephydatiae TaxID=2528019 RepID=A0A518GQL8_9PLAN|nr:Trehalose utilization [Planctopirus ephydatiae]
MNNVMSKTFWWALSILIVATAFEANQYQASSGCALAEDIPQTTAPKAAKTLKALLVTGGCCHDYQRQKKILTEGISARANVQWEIVHQGGSSTNAKIPLYENPDWAKGFDVVVHNECFADIPDASWTQKILAPHKAGLPAVVIHCAMHCYRDKTDEWFKFLGVTSHGHGAHYAFEVVNAVPEHPIMKGFGNKWMTPKGELYNIAKIGETTTPLAYGKSSAKKDECVIWVNEYGDKKTRVFGTTVGHYAEEMQDPVFLNYVTRGLLWSADKLNDDYLISQASPRVIKVPENLALGKTATASGSQAERDPKFAVDGDEETRWCAPNGGSDYTWQVDLGEPKSIAGIRIAWESPEGGYKFRVETSVDGKVWSPLVDQSQKAVLGSDASYQVSADQVRYVRLVYLGSTHGGWGSFWEFEVHSGKMIEQTVDAVVDLKPKAVSGAPLLSGVKVPPSFEATVFAAPPEISYPTCLTTSPDGLVFVGVDLNGSLGAKPQKGKIVRCRDTNGDGKADEFISFCELDSPRGLVWDDGTLYVQHPPFVTAFHDRDGDGKSEKSEVLVDGIGFDLKFRGADHTTNGMQMGIDGYLYIAVGDYGFYEAKTKDGKTLQLHGGGVVRVKPDGTDLEIVSRGQRNIYDVAIDPEMNLLTRDNTNDGGGWNVRLSHVVPFGNYGYPSQFINFPEDRIDCLADFGGGSPCGSVYIDDPALPSPLGRSFYTCDWGRSIIFRHPLTPAGSTFKAEQEPFVHVPRPTDMEIDASGRIYIASWKNGGFDFDKPDVGYVLLLTPRGAQRSESLDFSKLSMKELVALVGHEQGVTRLAAQRELLRRPEASQQVAALKNLALQVGSVPKTGRLAAVFTLGQIDTIEAIKALEELYTQEECQEAVLLALGDSPKANQGFVVAGLSSSHPRVVRAALTAIGRQQWTAAASQIIPVLANDDAVVTHVAKEVLVSLRPIDVIVNALGTNDSQVFAGVIDVAKRLHDPRIVNRLLELVSSGTEQQQQHVRTALCRLHFQEAPWDKKWWGTRPDTTGPYFKPVTWSQSDQIRTALEAALEADSGDTLKHLVKELRRHRVPSPRIVPALLKLAQSDRNFYSQAIRLLASTDDRTSPTLDLLSRAAISESNDWATRSAAIRGLMARLPDPQAAKGLLASFGKTVPSDELPNDQASLWTEYLQDARHAENVPLLTERAFDAQPGEQEVAWSVLLSLVEASRTPAAVRDQILATFQRAYASPQYTVQLLKAVARTQAESQAIQVRQFTTNENGAIAAAARFASEKMELDRPVDPNEPLVGTLSMEDVVAGLEKHKGDAKLGARLFKRQGCVACHSVSSKETIKGPLLAGITARYNRAELTESIILPSKKIAQGFETQSFLLTDGRTLSGFVTREGGDDLELRSITGVPTVVQKADIDERTRLELSMMPVDLVSKLTVKDLASLMAYLESIKQ